MTAKNARRTRFAARNTVAAAKAAAPYVAVAIVVNAIKK